MHGGGSETPAHARPRVCVCVRTWKGFVLRRETVLAYLKSKGLPQEPEVEMPTYYFFPGSHTRPPTLSPRRSRRV